ncbi:MAG TPA: hypothetical protein VK279_02850, partial [Solirubrobacteraceae bacterium]|nr:hypothetical protein [Solirubrobacteraceae bacterium]
MAVQVVHRGQRQAARRSEALGGLQADEQRADAGLREPDEPLPHVVTAELAWGFQDAVVDVLVSKTIRAAREVS